MNTTNTYSCKIGQVGCPLLHTAVNLLSVHPCTSFQAIINSHENLNHMVEKHTSLLLKREKHVPSSLRNPNPNTATS